MNTTTLQVNGQTHSGLTYSAAVRLLRRQYRVTGLLADRLLRHTTQTLDGLGNPQPARGPLRASVHVPASALGTAKGAS